MKNSKKFKSSANKAETGDVLASIAGIILALGTLWIALSALFGCTPTY